MVKHFFCFDNFTNSIFLLVALFSVERDRVYLVETNESLTLCVELVDGCLQRLVQIDFITFDGTADSKAVHIFLSAFCGCISYVKYFRYIPTCRAEGRVIYCGNTKHTCSFHAW